MENYQNITENDNGMEAQIKELGSKLRRIREAQKLSIAEISNKTKIQKHYLSAIEEGNLDLLPKGPYVRSFIRQYCEYLSAKDLWSTYDSMTKEQKNVSPVFKEHEEQSYSDTPKVFKSRSYMWLYLLVVISLGAAGWITWQYRGDMSNVATSPIDGGTTSLMQSNDIAPKPLSSDAVSYPVSVDLVSGEQSVDLTWMDGAPSDQPKSVSVAPVMQKKPGVQQSKALKVIAENGTVWVKISQSGTIFFEGILTSGESKEYEVGPDNPIRVRFGNPGKTAVTWDAKTISPIGTGSRPITKYFWSDGSTTDNDKAIQ